MVLSPFLAPVTWRLQTGAAGAPWVRLLGDVLLLALSVLCVAWLLALGLDVWRGGRSPWVVLTCAPIAWLWWHLFRHAWASLHTVAPVLSLTWAGPVQDEPVAGGWRMGGLTGTPADVRCLLDAQGWLLCRIQAVGEGTCASTVHWCWIHTQSCPDVHRFRTLISLPSRLTTVVGGESDVRSPAVASWSLRRQPSGIDLRGPSDTFMPTQPLCARGEAPGPTDKDRS